MYLSREMVILTNTTSTTPALRTLVSEGYVVALIDLGTNSVRLLVVRINTNGGFETLFKHREMVRLGDGLYESGLLGSEAMTRTITALGVIADLCRNFGVSEIVAFATAATRDAKNSSEFIERVHNETAIDLKIISGKEEARLIYTGVAAGVPLGSRTAVFIDIGGGSTEISLGNSEGYFFLDSLSCGCVRFSNRFFTQGDTAPVSPKTYKKICEKVRNSAQRALDTLQRQNIDIAVGSSGTIENLAEIALRLKYPNERLENMLPEERLLRYSDLTNLMERICSIPLEKRRELPGMNPKRADVIVAGGAIIQTLMSELGLKEILVSSRGLQEGILLDYMRKSKLGFPDERMPVRELSVLQLAKLCRVQEQHSEHVANLALSLFDSACNLGLITPNPDDRELLRYTALLHDIGIMLSVKDHHAHSCYFIRNAEMAGFYDREIEIIAGGAFCHGKKNTVKEYISTCPDAIRTVVLRNGALLRLCEAMDRSHRSLISNAVLNRYGRSYTLALRGSDMKECSVELSATQKNLSQLKTAFGREFSMTFTDRDGFSRIVTDD